MMSLVGLLLALLVFVPSSLPSPGEIPRTNQKKAGNEPLELQSLQYIYKKESVRCVSVGLKPEVGHDMDLGTECKEGELPVHMPDEHGIIICSICCVDSYFDPVESMCKKCGSISTNNSPGISRSCSDSRPTTSRPLNEPDTVDLLPPSNLIVQSGSDVQTLKWTIPPGEKPRNAEYIVEIMTSEIGGWERASTKPEHIYLNQSEAKIPGLVPFNDYQYRIYAESGNRRGKSSVATPVTRTLRGPPSIAPKGIYIELTTSGQYKVTFKKIPLMYQGTDRKVWYMLRLHQINANSKRLFFIPSGNVKILPKFNGGVKYKVSVQADNHHGGGPWSRPVTFVPAKLVPQEPPTNVKIKDIQAYKADIVWDEVDSTDDVHYDYTVQLLEEVDGRTMKIVRNTTQLGTTVDNLHFGTRYRCRVVAHSKFGIGPWSAMQNFTTKLKPPQLAPRNVKVKIFRNLITAKWEPIQTIGEDEEQLLGYKIEYWKPGSAISSKKTVNTCLQFEVPKESKIYVRVRGYSDGGSGRTSQKFSVSSTQELSDTPPPTTCASSRVEASKVIRMFLFVVFSKLFMTRCNI